MNNNVYQKREDGQLKIAIKEEQITVASESRATIHIGIVNESPNEEYLDIVVRGVPAEWVTVHTPILHVAPGEAKLVTLTIQPSLSPDGHVGQYPLEVRAVTQSEPQRSAVARTMLTVAAYQSRGRIGVMLASIYFAAAPGSIIDVPILMENRGDQDDSFRMRVSGLPAEWVSTNAALTRLEPGASAEILLTVQVPRSSQAVAGRWPFTIQFISELFPTQTAEVDCILTIAAFSQLSSSLEPSSLQADQFGQVIIQNEGNTTDSYFLSFQSPTDELIFEKAVQVTRLGPQGTPQQAGISYVEITPGEQLQVAPGERGVYAFRARPRFRPFFGNEHTYPFTVTVHSSENETAELTAQLSVAGLIPFWVLPIGVVAALVLCLLLMIPLRGLPTAARATQTAAFLQTQAAIAGPGDSDGDGLTNDREIGLGTDPLLPDTDGDRLLDREEVETHQTNPRDTDSDDDRLLDGDEIQTHQTDPRNPDTDGDGRADGDEIAGGSDARNADTDGDGLRDGDEIRLNADPRNPDTDGDGLSDSQESAECPRPSDPDSDDDGTTDGRDLNPCDPANPLLTATAAAQATAVAPTATLPATATIVPTNPPAASPTPATPNLQGILLFASNRVGNSDIHALNLANQSLTRLTNSNAQDMQPALAPDSVQVAYVTNQDGNNEIYLTGVDGRVPSNLTNNPADDQQPTWSPDGNWIAFTTNRDGNQEIYVMSRDGTQVRNLTNNAANDFAPTWFSTGALFGAEDWIAFTTTRDGNQEIYKVKADGTGLTNLTRNPAGDHSPAGFTGGGLLAFVSDRDGNAEIYTMTDNGGAPTRVTNNPAQDLDPAINPGGNWIAFSTERDGNPEVYVVGTGGGAAYNLTRDAGEDRYPDW